jgi:CRISPR-associated endonuclease/helicase Cas3
MKQFLSHIYRNENKEILEKKPLVRHISSMLSIVEQSYKDAGNDKGNTAFPTQTLLQTVIRLHDLGKYSSFFQQYLLTEKRHRSNFHYHALTGAHVAYKLLQENTDNDIDSLFALFCIRYHHGNLRNIEDCTCFSATDEELLKQHAKDISPHLAHINNELQSLIDARHLAIEPDTTDFSDLLYGKARRLKKSQNIRNYFAINYLFSLLIESDKLDASQTSQYKRVAIQTDLVENVLIEKRANSNVQASKEQQERRDTVRDRVLQHLQNKEILTKSLFTLTAPTGSGKTLTAIDFALGLRALIRDQENREAQIIYALPFINIVEQTFDDCRKTLALADADKQGKALAHYQFADVFGKEIHQEQDGKLYWQKMMELDTWQCDMVVTTFVQFFETLIGNRNKLLKKFHHFAGAIIILDEVQTLRAEHLPLFGATLLYLAKYLNTRIIMMTATRPMIFQLAAKHIKEVAQHGFSHGEEVYELLSNYESIFAAFHRTRIVPCFQENKHISTQEFLSLVRKYRKPKQSCLIVCNKVNRSIELFEMLEQEFQGKPVKVFCLSTNITPRERQERLEEIKDLLKPDSKIKPILVATQCVEAGVDIDFDMGFRDLAPIDSIIQVAGRINRNDRENMQYSPLYVVNLGDCKKIYGEAVEKVVQESLLQFAKNTTANSEADIEVETMIVEPKYLSMIQHYYEKMLMDENNNYTAFGESKQIFQAMLELRYDSALKQDERCVADFRVIKESQDTRSVFIELDDKAAAVRREFENLLSDCTSVENFAPFKAFFHQHIIAVPKYYTRTLEADDTYKLGDNILFVPLEKLHDFYCDTGFIRSKQTAVEEEKISLIML